MKKTLFIILVTVALAGSASAQLPSLPFSVYLRVGASVPQEDFNHLYKLGYHLGGGVGYDLVPRLETVARVSLHKYSPESDAMLLDIDLPAGFEGGDLNVLMYGADLKLNLGLLVSHPFILAGFGRARFSTEDVTFSVLGVEETRSFDSYTDSYWVLGGGFEYTYLFIEGRYINFLESDSRSERRQITLSVGLKL